MKTLLSFLLSAVFCAASTCTLTTGTYATLAATAGHYTGAGCTGGSYVPAAPDVVATVSGVSVTVASGETLSLGSTASSVGIGLRVVSGASWIVAPGASVTLAGFDSNQNSNAAGQVDAGGTLTNNGTVSVDSSGDYVTVLFANGTVNGSGVWTVPNDGRYSWSVQVTAAAFTAAPWGGTPTAATLSAVQITANSVPISNSAGTGVAVTGNSSLSFASLSGGTLTTEVASPLAVLAAGQYWVDYRQGFMVFYGASSLTGTATYKSFTQNYGRGWGIVAGAGAVIGCAGCTFQYMGRQGQIGYPYGGTVDLSAGTAIVTLTNPQFLWSYKPLFIGGTGTPVFTAAISGTWFWLYDGWGGVNVYGSTRTVTSPVFDGSVIDGSTAFFTCAPAETINLSGWLIQNVTAYGGNFLNTNQGCPMAGGKLTHNTAFGVGGTTVSGTYWITGMYGAPGSAVEASYNSIYGMHRVAAMGGQAIYQYNNIYNSVHHVFVASNQNDVLLDNTVIRWNWIQTYGNTDGSAAINSGYNHRYWVRGQQVYGNTLIGPANGAFAVGDGGQIFSGPGSDSGSRGLAEHLTFRDNLAVSPTPTNSFGMVRGVSSSANAQTQRAGIDVCGWNWWYGWQYNYGPGNSTSTGILGCQLFGLGGTDLSHNYNGSGAAAVTGVSLWNGTYAANSTGSALKFVKSSSTNMTLAWSKGGSTYGTAAQLVWPSSGTSYTVSSVSGVTGWSNVSVWSVVVSGSPGWSNTDTNAACPVALRFWDQTAGLFGVVTNVTAPNTVTVVFPGGTPATSDTVVILQTDLTLPDEALGTVEVGIDASLLPSASQTDTGISITLTDTANADPLFLNGNTLPAFEGGGAFRPTAKATCAASSTGQTPGYAPCGYCQAIPFRLSGTTCDRTAK